MRDFLASEQKENRPEKSFFHVIPVPMEATVSYGGGTAKGPGAILAASRELEAWDGRSMPLELGIHTTNPVDCGGCIPAVLSRIREKTANALDLNALPVLLGGEHTLTLGALRALKAHCSDPFGIVQFDAHADLRDEYQGDRFSHACVMKRALDELDLPLFQIGVRALSKQEHDLRQHRQIPHLSPHTLFESGVPETILPDDFPSSVYITFDVDGLDPSVIRSTGTPVPGGLTWFQAHTILEKIIRTRKVTGFDVVELAPQKNDLASDFAAAQLTYTIMGMIQRNRRPVSRSSL